MCKAERASARRPLVFGCSEDEVYSETRTRLVHNTHSPKTNVFEIFIIILDALLRRPCYR
jgi:hypothetical protein